MALDKFWQVVEAQIEELKSAKTADDVLRILSHERNPYGPREWTPQPDSGFFAGSGGDYSVADSLEEAGWTMVSYEAHYYWVMRAPNGDKITYVEGDIYRGNQMLPRG